MLWIDVNSAASTRSSSITVRRPLRRRSISWAENIGVTRIPVGDVDHLRALGPVHDSHRLPLLERGFGEAEYRRRPASCEASQPIDLLTVNVMEVPHSVPTDRRGVARAPRARARAAGERRPRSRHQVGALERDARPLGVPARRRGRTQRRDLVLGRLVAAGLRRRARRRGRRGVGFGPSALVAGGAARARRRHAPSTA